MLVPNLRSKAVSHGSRLLPDLIVRSDRRLVASQSPPEPAWSRPSGPALRQRGTDAILAQWPRFRSERDFWRFAHSYLRPYFPTLCSQSQLNRRIRALEPELRVLQHDLARGPVRAFSRVPENPRFLHLTTAVDGLDTFALFNLGLSGSVSTHRVALAAYDLSTIDLPKAKVLFLNLR